MPAKKKSKARKPKSTFTARKLSPVKKVSAKKTAKKTTVKSKSGGETTQRKNMPRKHARKKSRPANAVFSGLSREPELAAGQSGDLQGLSNTEDVNSESVDELLEEGNALEAEAVAGVEEADDADEREVHTHEVPEDDVPEEYLDQD